MSEGPPRTKPNETNSEERRKDREIIEFAALILEIRKNEERFPFPGIDPEAYAKLKNDEEEFPGYATPIDSLIARFRDEGAKIMFGADSSSGNIFILPSGSNDIEKDGLFPRHLLFEGIMDGRLKQLIKISKTKKW